MFRYTDIFEITYKVWNYLALIDHPRNRHREREAERKTDAQVDIPELPDIEHTQHRRYRKVPRCIDLYNPLLSSVSMHHWGYEIIYQRPNNIDRCLLCFTIRTLMKVRTKDADAVIFASVSCRSCRISRPNSLQLYLFQVLRWFDTHSRHWIAVEERDKICSAVAEDQKHVLPLGGLGHEDQAWK